ncbi:biosynthetic-type acetolactate synthase large subunit [Chitinophaga pinensis]|uniref:Acetolactate synthase n=1 Tax=Chitinophaga pinensis (strain ATCC 43595 / DSM 2588 / LMG 13176 / NBRC 15968 / NCIMB 11800 / UQM 2034) TaxID=485918 RepID=A0A979GA67_CHIPD|nr:biosynthetic-type acetolactate synthase large subunit [Chitinophaga pinensis]ACU63537.1 acetolactate synthase, large subunit, biosynthetic type [Chitinophaga pinensis DSM 2588]
MESTHSKEDKTTSQQQIKTIPGSVAIMEALIAEETEVIFGVPGGANIAMYDALFDYDQQLKHILVRHEQGGIHAAQGYARASGKIGVVFVTSGPGATNLITGIADAMIDSTPVVCITGQVFAHLLGSDAFQETDIINISTPVTKWNYQITDAAEIPSVLAKAFYIARSGRPGPVLIDITKNAQLQLFEYTGYEKCDHIRSYRPKPVIREKDIQSAAALINHAEKPFVIWGQGVILGDAVTEFKTFIEKSGIPAAWTVLGAGVISSDHPLNMGMLGMHGNYAPNVLTNECDLLIAIGMRFDDRVTGRLDKYARQAKVIHLEIDPAEINKNIKSTVSVLGDCKETLPLLTASINRKDHGTWIEKFNKLYQEEYDTVIQPELHPTAGELTMGEVINILNEFTSGDAIVVSDVGQNQMAAIRYAKFNHTRSNITSGGLGTMGFSLPAALGARYGAPDKTVLAIVGDGGFQMNIQELGTIMQHSLDIKIIILNNQFLGMVRQWQELFNDRRYAFSDMENPDFVALAAAYRISGQRVSERERLRHAIAEMFHHKGPYLLEVMVGKENNIFPMVPQGASISEIRLK